MLGLGELKESIDVTEKKVECPVKGCDRKVARQRKSFKKKKRFRCPEHRIYISPSTFEYEFDTDNLLWHGPEDLSLLNEIRTVKRESRVARDNSEDALTWNVFRFLEEKNAVSSVINPLLDVTLQEPEVIYWSYCRNEGSSWPELKRARGEFGEHPRRSSEPDVIIDSKNALLFIEAKFTAGNKTTPHNEKETKKYLTGGGFWFPRVFTSNYHTVAIEEKKYELMRFWLLGTWIADQRGIDFYLVNLVREGKEEDIEEAFGKHIRESEGRRFVRVTWEDIYREIPRSDVEKTDKEKMIGYFRNKSTGYDGKGDLQKAFRL